MENDDWEDSWEDEDDEPEIFNKLTLLPPQLYVGREDKNLAKDLLTPITNREEFGIKPHGGLWTSSYDPVCGSGWVQWSASERFSGDWDEETQKTYYNCYLVQPKPARILVIDTLQDLKDALVTYQMKLSGEPQKFSRVLRADGWLDFELLAHDYDAMHLTERGQWATRMTHPGLYGWDCESTIWFRWKFSKKVEFLGRVGFPYCDKLEIEEKKLKILGLLRKNPLVYSRKPWSHFFG